MRPKYISSMRCRPSDAYNASKRTILEEAHSDRGRVVFSASFRRLMQKTQVFALESYNARTRLTHSLEVAHIGTYIVDEVFLRLKEVSEARRLKGEALVWVGFSDDERMAVRSFVEVACLVHDIGNPPFGHFGEKAICAWFMRNSSADWCEPIISAENISADFEGFDGNKQGFRILSKLQRNADDQYGLNLTKTQLAATIKYPVYEKARPRKCSYFFSEADLKDDVWASLGLDSADRHPLSLLMEAADDIAYCVSDLEDASEKGLVSWGDLKRAFPGQFANRKKSLSAAFTKARTDLTNTLVKEVAERFVDSLENGLFICGSALLDDRRPPLSLLKEVTARKVYSSNLVLTNEITGYRVIQGLLDAFSPLLVLDKRKFQALMRAFKAGKSIYSGPAYDVTKSCTQEPALLSLFPKKHLAVYEYAVKNDRNFPEIFHRLHLIIDFIAGMTDNFALEIFKLIDGDSTHG